MSVSLNSTNDSTTAEATEEVADLNQNNDEVLDLELGLAALGGLRHSAACSASERSTRRYEERNHRFHESRMKKLGMEGEEKEPEAEDMSQQVLIRSPVIHNHYSDKPNGQPVATAPVAPTRAEPTATAPATPGLSNLAKGAIAAGILASGLGLGGGATYLWNRPSTTTVVNPIEHGPAFGISTMPPGPPVKTATK